MRHLQYLEIRNFKGFGDRTRIELDHPAVLVGPNNCGKTTALQAIALWSQAVRTWFDRKGRAPPRERTATGLNRLAVVAVPVRSARDYWHNMAVRTGPRNIPLEITLGVLHDNRVKPVTMLFRCFGDETVYCTPDEATLDTPDFIQAAAGLNVRLLYPMSGIETEEPIVQPGRIDVLLGQGQTAQVLRNLCLMVFRENPQAWSTDSEAGKPPVRRGPASTLRDGAWRDRPLLPSTRGAQAGGHRARGPGASADAPDPRPSALASPERASDRRTRRAPGNPPPETGVRASSG